ncbi:MAG: NAC family transcription factor [Cytophagales bacterium]|nr:NAC family transcription factor [Cytophagales bacterium]
MNTPKELEYDLLTGTCLDNYIGSNNQFRIKNESEYESIMDQFECAEFLAINFKDKELLGSVFSFTGTNETKEEFSIFRDGDIVEVLHCIIVIPTDEELISNVETYLSKWLLTDKLNPDDSVIFTIDQN